MENVLSPTMAFEQRERYWELENLGQTCLMNMTQLYKKVSSLGIKYQDKSYLTNKIDGFLKLISTATSVLQTNILSFQAKGACIVATRLVLSAVSMVIVHCINSADVVTELYRERNVDLLQTNIMTLEIVEMMIENAVTTDPNYLFFLPPEHDDWKMINKVFESNNQNNFGVQYQKALEENLVSYGVANMGVKKDSGSVGNLLRTIKCFIYYSFKKDRAKIIADKFLNTIAADRDYSLKVININKDPLIGSIISYKQPPIKEHYLILVPKLINEINLSTINDLNNNIETEIVRKDADTQYIMSAKEDSYDYKKYSQIRILCKHKIPIRIATKTPRKLKPFNIFNTVVIHIHGGGFICSSSGTHQHYLRKWALLLGVPIFSLDYRLAPEYKYPAALDDVLQAYYWIINYSEKYFSIISNRNISPENHIYW